MKRNTKPNPFCVIFGIQKTEVNCHKNKRDKFYSYCKRCNGKVQKNYQDEYTKKSREKKTTGFRVARYHGDQYEYSKSKKGREKVVEFVRWMVTEGKLSQKGAI